MFDVPTLVEVIPRSVWVPLYPVDIVHPAAAGSFDEGDATIDLKKARWYLNRLIAELEK